MVTSAVCVSFVLVWYIMIRNSSPTTSQRIMWFLTASCLSYTFSLRCYLYMSMEMCPSNISEYIYIPPPSPPGPHVCIQNTTDTPQTRTPNPQSRDTKLSFPPPSKDSLDPTQSSNAFIISTILHSLLLEQMSAWYRYDLDKMANKRELKHLQGRWNNSSIYLLPPLICYFGFIAWSV